MLAFDVVNVGSASEMLDVLINGCPDLLNRCAEGDDFSFQNLACCDWVLTEDLETDFDGGSSRLATISGINWLNE